MKFSVFFGALLFELLQPLALAEDIRALFLFKDVMKSNTTGIKTSGFNAAIIFGVGITETGDIMYYSNTPGSSDVLVASGGAYTGGDDLAAKVQSLKTGDTNLTRVEISMNSQHVLDLMASPGPGSDTNLYQNFVALKAAWNLDAVNNDDESIYDVDSTVAFAHMLGDIGYKYTIAPYTMPTYWTELIQKTNTKHSNGKANSHAKDKRLLDRVYLQCYDGGANNDPTEWAEELGMDVVPLLWVTNESKPQFGATPQLAMVKFSTWDATAGLIGGGYWNDFDIEAENSSYTAYGKVLLNVFP